MGSSRELKENQSLSHAAYHRQTYADSFFPDKKLIRADKNDDEDDEDEDDEADDDDDYYSSEGSWTSGSDSDECSEDEYDLDEDENEDEEANLDRRNTRWESKRNTRFEDRRNTRFDSRRNTRFDDRRNTRFEDRRNTRVQNKRHTEFEANDGEEDEASQAKSGTHLDEEQSDEDDFDQRYTLFGGASTLLKGRLFGVRRTNLPPKMQSTDSQRMLPCI